MSYPSRRFLRKPDLFGDTPYLRRLIIATSVSFAQNLVTAESIIDKRLRHYLRQDIWHMFYLRFDIKSRGAFRMKTSRLCMRCECKIGLFFFVPISDISDFYH